MLCIMLCYVFSVLFFFFKQKTAYEMRISDWSSDVCSSDLAQDDRIGDARDLLGLDDLRQHDLEFIAAQPPDLPLVADDLGQPHRRQIGRASCRERVCQYV